MAIGSGVAEVLTEASSLLLPQSLLGVLLPDGLACPCSGEAMRGQGDSGS